MRVSSPESDFADSSFHLAPGARIRRRVPSRDSEGASRLVRVLLAPENSFPLELSEAAILELCDGQVPFPRIVEALASWFGETPSAAFTASIAAFLSELLERRLLVRSPFLGAAPSDFSARLDALQAEYEAPSPGLPEYVPAGLLAEVTYRCPLHCPYCSNPLELGHRATELHSRDWERLLREAAALGVLHAGFSGGEPLARPDLASLIAAAREAGLYTNLLTSGLGFTAARARELKASGLDSVQISFQADEETLANEIAGCGAHSAKLQAMRIAREEGFPLTLNVVLHARNAGRAEEIIAFAAAHGAQRLELASVQFYGWALRNRDALIPSRAQVDAAIAAVASACAALRGVMEIIYVPPDYFGVRPKPCMQGWGRKHITINPSGDVLPCPTAFEIPGMRFENVRSRSLREIWDSSEAFRRFRGTDWMPEPCRGCEFREIDFGGCRCQAAILTGDPAATDPACSLSPHRGILESYLETRRRASVEEPLPFLYRGIRPAPAY